jgi:hypothetical protein
MEQERAAKRARRETTGNKAESLSTIPESETCRLRFSSKNVHYSLCPLTVQTEVDVLGPLLTAPAARRKASLLQSYGSNSKKQNPGLNDRATFSDVAKNGSVVIPAESAIFSRPRNVPLPRPPSAVPSIVPNVSHIADTVTVVTGWLESNITVCSHSFHRRQMFCSSRNYWHRGGKGRRQATVQQR